MSFRTRPSKRQIATWIVTVSLLPSLAMALNATSPRLAVTDSTVHEAQLKKKLADWDEVGKRGAELQKQKRRDVAFIGPSLGLSGCVFSGCWLSGCGGSGCFGSVCGGTGCAGSACIAVSVCAGSGCAGGSVCTGSICGGDSICVGSVCAGNSVCRGSHCAGVSACASSSCGEGCGG